MVLSDGGGWNGDAAAGCPAVVVVGALGGVEVGVGAGGGRVTVRAGAARAARRAGRGFGASTVTCGTVTVGPVPVGGVWLPRTQIRAYRWCSPPRIGCAIMSPNRSIERVQGASLPSERCVRTSL